MVITGRNVKIAVIGAGPAGSVAAALLARAGLDVTLVEQHRFPRDKVCGECVSALGVQVLEELGAIERVGALGAMTLKRAMFHSSAGETFELPLPRTMLGVSRHALDAELLKIAVEAGARVILPARCEQVENSHVGVCLIVRQLVTNEVKSLEVAQVIVADGKGLPSASRAQELGVKAHFENIRGPRDAVELFGVEGHYGGLAPVEGMRWNASFSVPVDRVRSVGGDLDALWARIVEQNPILSRRMRAARRVSPWLASGLPRFGVRPLRDWPECAIPVGNALAAIEPIGGEGIGLAMRSAQLAALALIEASREGRPPDRATLHAQFAKLFRSRRLMTRLAAMMLSRPMVANWLIGSLQSSDPFTTIGLRLAGKTA